MMIVKLTTSIAGRRFSFVKNDFVEVPDQIGANWVKGKVAVQVEACPAGEELKQYPKPVIEKQEGETPLPEDTPSYELLIKNELTTVEAVLAHEDLTKITGIGAKSKEAIFNHLKPE